MVRRYRVNMSALDLRGELSEERPRGDQIRERLEDLAARLGPGTIIPSDRQLAEHFGVARMTVRTEIKRLTFDGVLEVEQGRGTFVSSAPRFAPEWGTSYTFSARAAQGEPSATLVQSAATAADARTAGLLRIREGDPVFTLTRLRALDGRRVGVERVSIPLSRFPGLEEVNLENTSLYRVLAERWGLMRGGSTGRVAATLPSESDAALLGVTVRDPCLVVQMISTDADGVVFEVGRSVYRADRYEVGIDLMHSRADG
ncbi:GntR family transcriptional regulator [Microbacterium sp. W4I4]|uniref:GntR family transcriptional regulator n=1 Tax=Microbacterium sp. W4I4 TaxID=3042295 RepID=UPI00277D6C7F|nr:GntR family transcriptional regulator [Microbacterium sp. W4I4]MDQ0615332.1 GntR family transcriptional regulator [Microbacterium sp. W4I4]